MHEQKIGTPENPIRPDKTKIKLSITLLDAENRIEAFANVLAHEPYIETYREIFPEREAVCQLIQSSQYSIDFKKHLNSPNFKTIHNFFAQEEPESEVGPDWVHLTDAVHHNVVRPAARDLPCPGYQNWFNQTPRPKSLVIALPDDMITDEIVLQQMLPDSTLVSIDKANSSEEEFDRFIQLIRNADMVCTDNGAVAFIALCLSVPKVTCLAMRHPEYLYDNNDTKYPEIKVFHRKNISQTEQYKILFDFVRHEWTHYVRYPQMLNVGNAQSFIQNTALKYCRGYGLDVGSNKWPLPGALPSDVDSRKFDRGPFDFIFSSHCLEHIENWEAELKLWHDSLKTDGIMFIYVPHPLMEMWLPEGPWVRGGWHKWSPDPIGLFEHLRFKLGMEVLKYTTRPDAYWSFYIVARKNEK